MLIYFHEVSLEDGFEILDNMKYQRLLHGRRVSGCSGWKLFRSLRNQPIRCWTCGCEADRWIADKEPNDPQEKVIKPPVLNLYGTRDGVIVLMTRDHIIPKSLGGTDAVENLRPACYVCNSARGNEVTVEELAFRATNPHLISEVRLENGKKKAIRAASNPYLSQEAKEKILAPFYTIDEDI